MKVWQSMIVAAVLALVLGPVAGAHAQLRVGGYAQTRLNLYDADHDRTSEFDIRRLRLSVRGKINEAGTEARLQLNFAGLDDRNTDGSINLTDAWVLHPVSPHTKLRLGYTTISFGFEEEYSSSSRLPLERSRAARSFFPGERDLGLYAFFTPTTPGSPEFALGYTNGMRDWSDTDRAGNRDVESPTWVMRAQWPLERKGSAGVSYMTSRRTRDMVVAAAAADTERRSFDQNCLGVHVRWNGEQGINFQGEYYDGRILDVTSRGWYGQVEYTPGAGQPMPFYRYDVFDNGNPNHSDYRRHTLGAGYDLDSAQRFTVQWENWNDGRGGQFDDLALQWQYKY